MWITVEYLGAGAAGIVLDRANMQKLVPSVAEMDKNICYKVFEDYEYFEDELRMIALSSQFVNYYPTQPPFNINFEAGTSIKAKKGFDVKYIRTNHLYVIPMYTLESVKPMDNEGWKQCATDLMNQLQTMHKNGIYHRDIKPENMMYNRVKNEFTMIDFGFATEDVNETDAKGTVDFMSPAFIDLCFHRKAQHGVDIMNTHVAFARRQGRKGNMYTRDTWVPCDRHYRNVALDTYARRSKPIENAEILKHNDRFALGLSLLELYAPNKEAPICQRLPRDGGMGMARILRQPREVHYINRKPHVMIKKKWVPLKAAEALDRKVEAMLLHIG